LWAFPGNSRASYNNTKYYESAYCLCCEPLCQSTARIRPIESQKELFQEILDAHVKKGELATVPEIVKLILENLVRMNFFDRGDRGLRRPEILIGQLNELFANLQRREKYGGRSVPDPAAFTDRLLSFGLIYPIQTRYLFFHDSFEDRLAEEVRKNKWNGSI
jgi:hypothetical protein